MSWPPDRAATTSRLRGSAMCQGSRPDSAAGRLGGAALSWDGWGAEGGVPAPPWLAALWLAPPRGRAVSQAATATTATTATASVAAMARRRRGVAVAWRAITEQAASGPRRTHGG